MPHREHNNRNFSTLDTTAHIVAAYLEKNRIPAGQIADLIASVSNKIAQLSTPAAPEPIRPVPPSIPRKPSRRTRSSRWRMASLTSR